MQPVLILCCRALVSDLFACTFHLFRLRLGGAFLPVQGYVCCAVPDDAAIPDFIDENWSFEGAFDLTHAPDGFELTAAAAAVRREGYYVFVAYSGPLQRRPASHGSMTA